MIGEVIGIIVFSIVTVGILVSIGLLVLLANDDKRWNKRLKKWRTKYPNFFEHYDSYCEIFQDGQELARKIKECEKNIDEHIDKLKYLIDFDFDLMVSAIQDDKEMRKKYIDELDETKLALEVAKEMVASEIVFLPVKAFAFFRHLMGFDKRDDE